MSTSNKPASGPCYGKSLTIPPRTRTFRTTSTDAGDRLDVVVTRHLADFRRISRTIIRGWIEEGRVLIDGEPAIRPAARCVADREVQVTLPPPPPKAPEAPPQEIPLSILYEDDDLLALDKPAGVLVHPSLQRKAGTLFDALVRHAQSWQGEDLRPSLVSRLDQETSGVLLVAKSAAMHTALAQALRAPTAAKEYLAVAYGRTAFDKGRIDLRILRDPDEPRRRITSRTEGQPSTTLYQRLDEQDVAGVPLTLLRCRLITGRTHQIRVHLSAQGLPLVGDPLYGAPHWRGIRDPELAALCRDFPRQALHAYRVAFEHPRTGQPVEVLAPVPPDLAQLLAMTGLGGLGEAAALPRRSITESV